MLKSQLEPSSTTARNYEPAATTMFVENIFDTVKKAKAAKAAAAKSLADSKLIQSSYQYSFGDMSPLKKKKKRKNTKTNGKIKKPATTPKKKASPRKHKIVNKKVGDQRKKSTPPKSPRKYTKRAATKIPAATDIDDEEAAFILSSISQRSFDSFYSRLNSCGSTNKITIPLEVSGSAKSFSSSSSDPVRNLAYYVMLDHNYWIVEPEAPAEPEVPVCEPEVAIEPEAPVCMPEVPIEPPVEVKVEIPLQTQLEDKPSKVEESPIDNKPIFECNTTCKPKEVCKTEEVEENNNKLVTPEKDISQIVAYQKKDTTGGVKKRWLRRAATEMKTPPKKKKKLQTDDEINTDIVKVVDVAAVVEKAAVVVEVKIIPEVVDQKTDIKVECNESPLLKEAFDEPKACCEDLKEAAADEDLKEAAADEDLVEARELVPKAEVNLVGDKQGDNHEMKTEKQEEEEEEVMKMKAEEINTEKKLCNESSEADENLISPIETKVEQKPEADEEPIIEQQMNITEKKKEEEEEVEIDEKSWDSVMNFHRLQLKKLTDANLRHSKTPLDNNTIDRSYSFQKARSLSLTPKSCENEFVGKADVNYSRLPSFPGCTMLNLTQHSADSSRISYDYDKHEPAFFHKSSPFAPQRSLSKTFLNNHCRARRFENGLTIPYNNSSSYETPSPFYGEPFYQKDEIGSRTSYSTYRAQKALQVTHELKHELTDPPSVWEKHFGRPLDEFTTQRCVIMKKCDETPLVGGVGGGISRILSKPTLSPAVTTLPKPRTSVSDPRLNPSLVNDTRKDEAMIPKKKLSLDQYRKRVSLTSIGDSSSIEEPSTSSSSSPTFDPVIAAEAATG